MTRTDRWIAWALLAWIAFLAAAPLVLQTERFRWTFSEEGPVEVASMILWIVAAAVVLVRIRPFDSRAAAFALLYLAFAAREADWHKAFTADSMLKSAYYRSPGVPLAEKLVAGAVAVALLCLLVYVLWVVARFLVREGGWRSRSGVWLLAGFALLFLTKILDRAPATLAVDYGVRLAPLVGAWFSAFEEGLEAAMPMLLAWSAWVSQSERRYVSRPGRRVR